MKVSRTYGWQRPFAVPLAATPNTFAATAVPTYVDPIGTADIIDDQGELSSCTGNACADAHEIALKGKLQTTFFQRSRLFAYYNARSLEGTTAQDAGASITDVVRGAKLWGIAPEAWWPYNITRFARRPTPSAYVQSDKMRVLVSSYERVIGLTALKAALARGLPVMFGFSVPDYFEDQQTEATGWVRFPTSTDEIIGGHAVVAVGYDNRVSPAFVWVRNSWGPSWGCAAPGMQSKGYFKMDQRWFTDPAGLVDDMWTIHPT